MSSEPNPNSDITPTVHGLMEKYLEQLKEENKLDQENFKDTPEALMDVKFCKNTVKMVAQRLDEKVQEVQEFRDKLRAIRKRYDNLNEDLKFIKMMMLKADKRLDDLQMTIQGVEEI